MTDDIRARIDAAILAWEDQNDIRDPEAAAIAGCAASDLLREVLDLIPEPIPYPDDDIRTRIEARTREEREAWDDGFATAAMAHPVPDPAEARRMANELGAWVGSRQNQYGPSSVITDAAVMLRAYADRYEERADEEREALERPLGAHRIDRDGDLPIFDGRVLSHRQACAVVDAILASGVWRNRTAK